jgi:hypothetical protein
MAPAAIVALLLALHMVDNLMNAMVNPLYMIMAAGLAGFVSGSRRARPRVAPAGARAVATPVRAGAAPTVQPPRPALPVRRLAGAPVPRGGTPARPPVRAVRQVLPDASKMASYDAKRPDDGHGGGR